MICDLRRERKTLREIAQAIGRSPSTVSRELRRNAEQSGRFIDDDEIGIFVDNF